MSVSLDPSTYDMDALPPLSEGTVVALEWERWLAEHPALHAEIQATHPALKRGHLIVMCVEAVLGSTACGSGNALPSADRLAERMGWLWSAREPLPSPEDYYEEDFDPWEHQQHVLQHEDGSCGCITETHPDPSTRPSDIADELRRPRGLTEEDVLALRVLACERWAQALLYDLRLHTTLFEKVVNCIHDAARLALRDRFPVGEQVSYVNLRSAILNADTMTSLRSHWERTDGYVLTLTPDQLWEAAERELRADPESAALVEHFTVDGEVMRPLVAAMFSDNPYIARWLELEG